MFVQSPLPPQENLEAAATFDTCQLDEYVCKKSFFVNAGHAHTRDPPKWRGGGMNKSCANSGDEGATDNEKKWSWGEFHKTYIIALM